MEVMTKLSLPEKPDLVTILGRIKQSTEEKIELLLPAKPEFWNILSLKTLKKQIEYWGKEVELIAQDREGETLLKILGGEGVEEAPEPPVKLGLSAKFHEFWRSRRWSARGGWKLAAVSGGVLVALVCIGIFGLFFLSRTTVSLVLSTTPLVKTVEVALDPSLSGVDLEKMALPAIPIVVEETGSFETEATGEKEVGSKAEGSVIAYNYDTEKGKKFPKESPLVTSEGLKFLLNEEISLEEASESADPDNPALRVTEPDEVEVKATAEEIGPDYNIKEGSVLNFSDLDEGFWDDVFAKAKEDLSGGESKKVTVATNADQDRLLSESLENLSAKCIEGLSRKLVGDQKLEEKATEASTLEKKFSPALGEETEKIKLDLKVRCEGLAYLEGELRELLSGTLHSLVPEGFKLSSESPEITVLAAEKRREGEGSLLQTKVKGEVISEVDEEKIREALVGRTFSDAQAYFSTLANISSYRVSFWPPIPRILGRFPFSKERIQIVVARD